MNRKKKILFELNENLKATLLAIIDVETPPATRYAYILRAMALAHSLGYFSGISTDPEEPNLMRVFIELPTGQVSWPMPRHPREWDGSTDVEKFARINTFILNSKKIG